MTRKRYGKRKQNRNLAWFLIVGFVLVGIWLVASIWKGVNPIKLLLFPEKEGTSVSPPIPYDSLMTLYQNELALTGELTQELNAHKASATSKTVNISAGTLNMRSAASTSAEILTDIATGTQVKVFYCDKDSTEIGGTKGTWCKISHNMTEGWVWSRYLQ